MGDYVIIIKVWFWFVLMFCDVNDRGEVNRVGMMEI